MTTNRPPGLTLSQYAIAKHLPEHFLRNVGLLDCTYLGYSAVQITYVNPQNGRSMVRYRTAMAGDRFRWRKGDQAIPYGLHDSNLQLANETGVLYLVEGESDAQTLWSHGIAALGLPGASTAGMLDNYIIDVPVIYAIIEPDDGGQAMMNALGTTKLRHKIKAIRLDGYDDISSAHISSVVDTNESITNILKMAHTTCRPLRVTTSLNQPEIMTGLPVSKAGPEISLPVRLNSNKTSFADIKATVKIETVAARMTMLSPAGYNLEKGCCPLHVENTPSFMVYKESQHFHCYGCGAHGDVIDLLKHLGEL